jgi:inhibitor of cysteine peptidase
MRKKRIFSFFVVIISLVQLLGSPQVGLGAASFKEELPTLGEAESFSVLASQSISSLGVSKVTGGLGISPGTEDQKKGEWIVEGESYFGPSSLAEQGLESAKAYADYLKTLECESILSLETAQELTVLNPGVYCYEGSLTIDTDILLDSQGDPEAKFIFRIPENLEIEQGVSIASPELKTSESVYWLVDGTVLLEDESELTGTLIAEGSITAGKWVSVTGRLITLEGGISVDEISVTTVINELPPEPTEVPPVEPTQVPTELPTPEPTVEPTQVPTEVPTLVPTEIPTELPTPEPTLEPTEVPTLEPTTEPTQVPTQAPTDFPPLEPTELPTDSPNENQLIVESGEFNWKVELATSLITDNEVLNQLDSFVQNQSINGIEVTSTLQYLTIEGNRDLPQLNTFLFDDLAEVISFLGKPSKLVLHVPSTDQPIFVKLEERITTGYSWKLANEKTDQMFQVEASTTQSRYPSAGSPSIQSIEIMPLEASELTLDFKYERWFEPDDPVITKIEIWMGKDMTSIEVLDPTPLSFSIDPEQITDSSDGFTQLNNDTTALPASLDWRDYGIVTAVRDQGGCGSCWAFGTVGIMESAILKSNGLSTDLSEQFLVSCNYDGWNCNGGYTAHKYHYNKLGINQTQIGAVLEADKPYTATNGSCGIAYNHPYKLTGWQFITGSESTVPTVDQIKQALYTYGPVTAGVCVGNAFQLYDGGVFSTNEDVCYGSTNHQIILVGWYNATQTWILRNSWGPGGGDDRYMRIKWGTSRVGEGTSWVTYTPSVPSILAPSGYIYLKYPTFTWTKVPGATSYNVQVYTGSSLVINKIISSSACGTSECSAVIGPLPYVTNYFWRASAYKGSWGPWSGYKYFTRLAPIPTLVSPSGLITIPNPLFKWKPIPGATNYNIELYRNSSLYTYMTLTNSACSSTICQVRLSNNLPDGSYFWRVKVFIEGSWNSFSPYMYFTKSASSGFLNPGFEQGHVAWNEYSSNGWDVIVSDTLAHSGSWLAWLGGDNNETSMLAQTINISSAAPYLHFWYFSDSADYCGYDFFSVSINNQFIFSMNLCNSTNTYGWREKVLNLSSFVGSNKTVQFWVITDGSIVSNVFIDDVSMSAYGTQAVPGPVSINEFSGATKLRK